MQVPKVILNKPFILEVVFVQVKDPVDNFNQIILDLHVVGVTISDEDQPIILKCSFPNLIRILIILYILFGRETIAISDVKYTLQSKKLKRNVFGSNKDGSNLDLVVGRD